VLLVLSDFDPDGEEIAVSFARSMRDDFAIGGGGMLGGMMGEMIRMGMDMFGDKFSHIFGDKFMADMIGAGNIRLVKVALTHEQVKDLNLPPKMTAKRTSSRAPRFVEKYGEDVFELEALSPEDLQDLLRKAIESVIDREALNHELDAEKEDAAWLSTLRTQTNNILGQWADE